MDHRDIITALGGIRSLARKLGHPQHTTVQGWFERDRIPLDRWAEVIAIQSDTDAALTVDDFMPDDLRPDDTTSGEAA